VGFDSRWWLIEVTLFRASEPRAATFGSLYTALGGGAAGAWARELQLPPPSRNHLGLVLAFKALWASSPTHRVLQQRYFRREPYANGPPLKRGEHDRMDVSLALSGSQVEWRAAAKTLGLSMDGAPRGQLVVGQNRLLALGRVARDLLAELPPECDGWAVAEEFVPRDEMQAFLSLLATLPERPTHVLLTRTL
jgi:hypothetical protein